MNFGLFTAGELGSLSESDTTGTITVACTTKTNTSPQAQVELAEEYTPQSH